MFVSGVAQVIVDILDLIWAERGELGEWFERRRFVAASGAGTMIPG